MTSPRNLHAAGSLLGLAVGDALGTTLEFSRPGEFLFDALVVGPHKEVTGGGAFRVLPGQVTDDTMMACCLAASLYECEGLDPEDVGKRYVAWREVTFDCGGQTGSALSNIRRGVSALQSGKAAWTGNNAGNGSLMRTAPIGVYFAGSIMDIVMASVLDSNITHFDPRCSLACAAYNAAVGAAVKLGPSATVGPMMAEAREALTLAAGFFLGQFPEFSVEIDSALHELRNDLYRATEADPKLYSELHMLQSSGFVRVAFRLAFWELNHAPSFKAGLIDTVNRGGDSDTNGAIVGGLLGALFGEAGIPEQWKTTVLACDPPGALGKSGELHPLRMLETLDN